MKAAASFVAVGCVSVAFLFLAGCSSSSSVGVTDAAAPKDSSTAHDGKAKVTDAGADVSTGATCPGLADAAAGLTFPQACLTCLAQNCCDKALACAPVAPCKAILACEATCVAGGTAAQTCAPACITGDGGVPEGGTGALSPDQSTAYTLDICILDSCSSVCSQ
jgi:hypothetical protein